MYGVVVGKPSNQPQFLKPGEQSRSDGARFNITVAADDVFYQREDRLCTGLREGKVVDFRGSHDDGRFKQALSALIREFEDSPFSF